MLAPRLDFATLAPNGTTLTSTIDAGYCAHFDDLSDDLKIEIINRTYYSAAHPAG